MNLLPLKLDIHKFPEGNYPKEDRNTEKARPVVVVAHHSAD